MGDKMKWLYTFVLLAVTVGWAIYTVEVVRTIVAAPTAVGVLEASGTSVLLGALIAWCANVNQYWFRKKYTQDKTKGGTDETTRP